MAVWLNRLELSDVFHNEDLTFEQRRDEIVKRIKAAPFYTEDDTDDDLWLIVGNLEEDETIDAFDQDWDEFYDWCDAHRVWVETIS